MSSPGWILKCTEVPQFDALQNAAAEFLSDDKLHLRNLCNDSSRCAGLTAVHNSGVLAGFAPPESLGVGLAPVETTARVPSSTSSGEESEEDEEDAGAQGGSSSSQQRKIILDYSRQQVTGETMELLFDLADAIGFTERREAFRSGERINTTEDKAVLHHLLRMPKGYHFTGSVHSLAESILDEIQSVRLKIQRFTQMVRKNRLLGVTGKPLRHTIVVNPGGMHLGTEFVHEALAAYPPATDASHGRTLHFLSNVDPVDSYLKTWNLNPEETLIVLVAKQFESGQALNARAIRNWLLNNLATDENDDTVDRKTSESEVIERHMVAVTTSNQTITQHFGIPPQNIFKIWDWVIGRYSVCSAVGLLPLSLQYSYDIMSEFLDGAHDMDEHFFNAPLRDNIPVLLGLLGVWNSTFMGYTSRVILPYAQALNRFPAHVQLVDMESNGKRVALDGMELLHPSGEVNFGEPGTDCFHPFFQLMHQGRVIPADFIGFMESQRPLDIPGETVSSHDEFMSNFFAQPDALAYGKTLVDLMQEGVPDGLREHMVFTGNRPSSSILMTRLDAFAVGQLLTLYEHRTAVQGFVWGINSFDQFGLELGKLLARHVRVQLAASRRTGATVQGFNLSTSTLLEQYLAHDKQAK